MVRLLALALAASWLVCVLGLDWEPDTLPRQIHLAYGATPSQMNVGWASNTRGYGSHVVYGKSPRAMTGYAKGVTREFLDGNENGTHWTHIATMTGLEADTTFFYRVQTGRAMSPIFWFTTLPPPSPVPSPVQRIMMFGDMGRKGGSVSLDHMINEVTAGNITAIIHAGDFAYDLSSEGGKRGSEFMDMIMPLSAYVPYMTCPGNHEISHNFSNYIHLFNNMMVDASGQQMWFSFDVGLIHFVSYSTEVLFAGTERQIEEQKKFLEADLQAANTRRDVTPWVIAFGHRPMYCSAIDGDDCTKTNSVVRSALEELFFTYGVDLIFEAHEHNYERLWPVYNETVTQKDYTNPLAPVHIISGAAGCNEQEGICTNPILGPRGDWSAFRASILMYGYGHMEAHNATHLYWEELLDRNMEVLDSIWVVQENHGPFAPLT